MIAPRITRALALDFPDVPDDAPVLVAPPVQAKPPRVWRRQPLRAGPLCDCAGCKAAEARLDARALEFAPGSMPAARGHR